MSWLERRASIPTIASVVALGLLGLRASFDLDAFDSAELALVAVTRGLGHPPGQPLHTLLGWCLTRLPIPPLALLALMSLVPASIALGVVVDRGLCLERAKARAPVLLAAAITTAALLASRGAAADVAARVEVYALAALLSVVAIGCAHRRTARSDLLTGLLVGASACVNPVVAAQAIGAIPIAMRGMRWRALPRLVLGGVVGLAPYAYVFSVRDREARTLVWGAPHDYRSFIAEITAHDFQRNVSLSAGTFIANLAHLAWDATQSGSLALIVFALAVDAALSRESSESSPVDAIVPALGALAIGMAMIASNVPYLARNPDYGGYLLVPLALAGVGLTRATCRLARWPLATAACSAGILATAIVPAWRAHPSGAIRAIANYTLESAPRGALVVVGSDHLLFPALYLQTVEHVRTDVTILGEGWASESWAWRWAMARDASLVVDFSPGLGGPERLARVIAQRAAGRAVVAESLALLERTVHGAVCPRGIGWSSSEGCDGVRRGVDATAVLLARAQQRAHPDAWDGRVVAFEGQALAIGALELGCSGLALRFYSAGAGDLDARRDTPACDGRHLQPSVAAPLLDIDRTVVREAARALDVSMRSR